MARKQDINVGIIAFTGLVGSLLLLIIIWGVQGWYYYEVDLLTEQRNSIDDNVDYNRLKAEQYTNLGDPVGNDAIFAAEVSEVVDAASPTFGYRWVDDSRQTAAIPIHEAMAQIVRQNSGQDVTAEEMRAADDRFVRIVNNAYADVMTPAEQPQENTEETPGH